MYKTVQKTCYTKVFYVTAFGFVGCILCFEGFGAFHFFHTQDETCWSINTSISCETSSNFDICSTCVAVASKPMFSYKFSFKPENLQPQNRCFVRGFPSIFNTSHKMPRLPWNLHLVTTSRSPEDAIRKKRATRHVLPRKMKMDTPKVLRLPRQMTMMVSKVLRPPRKMQRV